MNRKDKNAGFPQLYKADSDIKICKTFVYSPNVAGVWEESFTHPARSHPKTEKKIHHSNMFFSTKSQFGCTKNKVSKIISLGSIIPHNKSTFRQCVAAFVYVCFIYLLKMQCEMSGWFDFLNGAHAVIMWSQHSFNLTLSLAQLLSSLMFQCLLFHSFRKAHLKLILVFAEMFSVGRFRRLIVSALSSLCLVF